jgi:hypothetical protein
MNFDPGILVYLIFLAIILYSNHLKKRKQAQERAAQARKIEVPQPPPQPQAPPKRVAVPSAPTQSQLPDLDQWLDTLWGKKKPEPAPVAAPIKKSLHDQRREKQLQAQRAASLEETYPRAPVQQQTVQGIAKRVPIDAARFRTREDLQRAIVARVVLAPPKGLE